MGEWSKSIGEKGEAIVKFIFEDILNFVFSVRIEAEDLAEVRLARGGEHKAVEFRAAHGDFVRENHAFAEGDRFAAAHEALADERLADRFEDLMINVNRRLRFLSGSAGR